MRQLRMPKQLTERERQEREQRRTLETMLHEIAYDIVKNEKTKRPRNGIQTSYRVKEVVEVLKQKIRDRKHEDILATMLEHATELSEQEILQLV